MIAEIWPSSDIIEYRIENIPGVSLFQQLEKNTVGDLDRYTQLSPNVRIVYGPPVVGMVAQARNWILESLVAVLFQIKPPLFHEESQPCMLPDFQEIVLVYLPPDITSMSWDVVTGTVRSRQSVECRNLPSPKAHHAVHLNTLLEEQPVKVFVAGLRDWVHRHRFQVGEVSDGHIGVLRRQARMQHTISFIIACVRQSAWIEHPSPWRSLWMLIRCLVVRSPWCRALSFVPRRHGDECLIVARPPDRSLDEKICSRSMAMTFDIFPL